MTRTHLLRISVATLLATATFGAAPAAENNLPLAVDTARVSITGTSNVQAYAASTTDVRIVRVEFAPSAVVWEDLFKPGALQAFDVVVRAATLSSGNPALDDDLRQALKVNEHPDIVFRLSTLEPGPAPVVNAIGKIRVAGVQREAVLVMKTERRDSTLVVRGQTTLLMTDFGIQPPTGMFGAIKADPKVTVKFEAVLAVPLQ
jgi:polyisoprenoid-binding protein YceI